MPYVQRDFITSDNKLTRNDLGLGLIIQMITGHNRLKYHESKVNHGRTDPHCRFCGDEFQETSWHLIGNCSALWNQRGRSFECLYLDYPPQKWNLKHLLKFLTLSKMAELNKGTNALTL